MPRTERVFRPLVAVAFAALASLGLGGCLFGGECDCPDYPTFRVVDGTLRPRDGTGGFSATESLVVDRAAGIVTLTATREGRVVVERWRIASSVVGY